MLQMRARGFALRDAFPDVLRGLISAEEAEDIPTGKTIEGTADATNEPSSLRQAMNDSIPLKAVAARTPPPERKVAPKVYDAEAEFTLLDEPDGRRWLKNLDVVLANALTQQEVVDISDHASVKHVISDAGTPADVKRRVDKLLADAYGRFAEPEATEPGDALDEVVIAGEEHLAAG
jgi:hypothetical protein